MSDEATKQVLLLAQHTDVVEVDGHGRMTVARRTESYFGPKLTLTHDDTDETFRLIPAGFDSDPELWRAVVDDAGFIVEWELVDHVSAEIVEVGPGMQCGCGEICASLRERRAAVVGRCIH
ncbi:hypothetical protein [Halobaculum sp. D14]|uniref:hypothetical protein n=1 Tax=Halobaculum sp. D14 TaxID=3421642 RepID=UPI003EBC27BE